jgi:hypothetical protein
MDLPDAQYGEAQAFDQIQSGASMAPPSSGAPSGSAPPPQMPTPLGAPSQDPSQPVTAGADAGAGPGSAALGLPDTSNEAADLARRYGPLLPFLIRKADSPYASQDFRNQVRYLISRIG